MLEIQRLRQEQTVIDQTQCQRNPVLMAELKLLRQRRCELELRMSALQDSRKELMIQLEGLMKLLRVSINVLSITISDNTVTFFCSSYSLVAFE